MIDSTNLKNKEQIVKGADNQYYILANSSYTDDRTRVLNHGEMFGIFDRWGDITQLGEGVQGIYFEGTRFVSQMSFRLNGTRPLLLSSNVKTENESLSIDLTNPDLSIYGDKVLHKGVIHISRNKFLKDGVSYEALEITNYSGDPISLKGEFNIQSDFKDIFEVRGFKREKSGDLHPIQVEGNNQIVCSYKGLDGVSRKSYIKFSVPPDELSEDRAVYALNLEPHEKFVVLLTLEFQIDNRATKAESYHEAYKSLFEEIQADKGRISHIHSSNEQFNDWLNRSRFDLISLWAKVGEYRYPFAGVPWYNTVFGRDGLITALETLWIAPEVAKGVLIYLADHQATRLDPTRDAEPGKILHEARGGELAETGEIPFKQYYGTIDATPLFLVLAGRYYERTGDEETIHNIWPNIEAAIRWIDEYGDLDKDLFVEYKHKAENGLTNQGWKDSFDSIMHADGELADPPIALSEVQGYVYEAKLLTAMLARAFYKNDYANKLEQEADVIKTKFNNRFWDEELKSFVIALDGEKNPCRVRSSNSGHCLYSGIADADKAAESVKAFMSPDMFTGWGIRTLSSEAEAYNPMSYHNGSVWPHDTAIVAAGMARYGFIDEAIQVLNGLFNASIFEDLSRLPELFCGLPKRKGEAPTAYPVACSPQAWSVACIYLLLQSILQMEIDALKKEVRMNEPALPDFLNHLVLHDLTTKEGSISLEFHRYDSGIGVNVLKKPEEWRIITSK